LRPFIHSVLRSPLPQHEESFRAAIGDEPILSLNEYVLAAEVHSMMQSSTFRDWWLFLSEAT
jgi:hypothetical protein